MGAVRHDFLCAALFQHFRRLGQRAGRIDHVIHDHAVTAIDFADDVHDLGDIGFRPPLVDDRQVAVEPLCQRPGAHDAADVRRHHQQVAVILAHQVRQQDRRGINVIDRDVEEALDLIRMQVHDQDPLDAGFLQHVGHHLGRDRHPRRTRPPVLAGIAVVRYRRRDATGRCALQGIDHQHDFHQVVVGRRTGRLQHEHILAAHVFIDLDNHFAIRKLGDDCLAERNTELPRHAKSQFRVSVAGKNHQVFECHGLPENDR